MWLLFVIILSCLGAQEAFLNKTLLYRDEMVKKSIRQLAVPCYSIVLTSLQTVLLVAHARKEMVKLTLTGEDKVTKCSIIRLCGIRALSKTTHSQMKTQELSTLSLVESDAPLP